MLVEALVLGRQDGLAHDLRDVLDPDKGPALLAKFAQQIALRRENPERDLGLIVGQRLKRRQSRIKQGKDKGPQQGPNQRQAKQDRGQIDEPAL